MRNLGNHVLQLGRGRRAGNFLWAAGMRSLGTMFADREGKTGRHFFARGTVFCGLHEEAYEICVLLGDFVDGEVG